MKLELQSKNFTYNNISLTVYVDKKQNVWFKVRMLPRSSVIVTQPKQ